MAGHAASKVMSPPEIAPAAMSAEPRRRGHRPASGAALGGDDDGDTAVDGGTQRIQEPALGRSVPRSERLEHEAAQAGPSEDRLEDLSD